MTASNRRVSPTISRWSLVNLCILSANIRIFLIGCSFVYDKLTEINETDGHLFRHFRISPASGFRGFNKATVVVALVFLGVVAGHLCQCLRGGNADADGHTCSLPDVCRQVFTPLLQVKTFSLPGI